MTAGESPPAIRAPGASDRSTSAPSAIGRDQVAYVARLARLELTDEELERFTGQLASVLDHAADISALDLADLEPTAHPLPVTNVLRADEPGPSLDREIVLRSAPDVQDHLFKVPRILGDEP